MVILSGNDYAQNIPQKGIGRIFKFIKKTTADIADMTSEIVSRFENLNNCSGHFKYAKDVFVSLQENDLDDNEMDIYKEKVRECNTLYDYLNSQMTDLLTKNRRIERTENRSLQDLQNLAIFRGNTKRDKIRFSPVSRSSERSSERYRYWSVAPAKKGENPFISVNRFTLLETTTTTDSVYDSDAGSDASADAVSDEDAGADEDEDAIGDSDSGSVEDASQTTEHPKKKRRIGVFSSGDKNAGNTKGMASKNLKLVEAAKNRNQTDYTRLIKKLSVKHNIETWKIGVLKAKLRTSTSSLQSFKDEVEIFIQQQASSMNKLIRLGQMALQFLIEKIMDSGNVELMKLLNDAVGVRKGEGGISFWTKLYRYLNTNGSELPRERFKKKEKIIISKKGKEVVKDVCFLIN